MSPAMRSTTRPTVGIYVGDDLARYGFPGPHRFGPDRLAAFWREAGRRGLCDHDRLRVLEPAVAGRRALERFHLPAHIDHVRKMSAVGHGLLDHGDTPAFPGCYEAAATVVGTVLDATERIMAGEIGAAFVPIAGLHHARRGGAEGFCIFNDCSVAIETLKQKHGLERIGTSVVLASMHTLARFLAWDRIMNAALDDLRVVFLPLLNPVGMWLRQRSNGSGVDLMRNAPPHPATTATPLLGGQRISNRLPWYCGDANAPMELEARVLCEFVREWVFPSRQSMRS